MPYKTPESVLVVMHSPDMQVLLLERAANPGYWQSVTGSREGNESLQDTARREVHEETGILANLNTLVDWRLTNRYEIFPEWRHRYAPGVLHNTEHVFSLCLPRASQIRISSSEHTAFDWLDMDVAAQRCFSWSNRDAILALRFRLLNSMD